MLINREEKIGWEEGWDFIHNKGITKLKNILEGLPESQFTLEECMLIYSISYHMCAQRAPHDYSQQLYVKCREFIEDYITSTVLRSMRDKHDEFILREFVKRWTNQKVASRWFSRFFYYLDRYHIIRWSLPSLKDVCLTNFRDLEDKKYVGLHEQVFVRRVIELHYKYLTYVTDCFMHHSLFHEALKETFEVVCKGIARSSSADLLASFCDSIVTKSRCEELSDEAIEEKLEKVVKLLAYVSDEDLFAEFYRKKLANRLLFDKSANEDRVRSILTKLKRQFGGWFTTKMERMATDLTLARENQASFESYLKSNPQVSPGFDLTVTVLSTGFWQINKSIDLNLPAEMVKCVDVFKELYQMKNKHRKLTIWIHSSGTCIINGNFEPKTIELMVTTYQASVLLLFNASDRLSYSEIRTQLNLSNDEVVRLLHSLSCAKYKVLNKEPNTKTIGPNDYFEFNSKFTDRMRRIKIPLPHVDEKKKVIKDVDKERQYAIDASIVRIMKRRKVLDHQQLVMECVEQLSHSFKPDFKAIKKRIEHLINMDYLERDKDKPNIFRYLA